MPFLNTREISEKPHSVINIFNKFQHQLELNEIKS